MAEGGGTAGGFGDWELREDTHRHQGQQEEGEKAGEGGCIVVEVVVDGVVDIHRHRRIRHNLGLAGNRLGLAGNRNLAAAAGTLHTLHGLEEDLEEERGSCRRHIRRRRHNLLLLRRCSRDGPENRSVPDRGSRLRTTLQSRSKSPYERLAQSGLIPSSCWCVRMSCRQRG